MISETHSCDMYLIDSHAPLQLSKHFPLSPSSDSCLSKIHMKTCGEESDIEELFAIPTKFRNQLLLFHYHKIAIAQNYERKLISFIECIL